MPRAYLVVDRAGGLRPVHAHVLVVLEVAGPARALLGCGSPGSPAATRSRALGRISRRGEEARPELGDVDVVVLDRVVVCTSMLPVSSSESIRCQVEPQCGVAFAQRPGEWDRAAVARQRGGVQVDRAETRNVEGRLRDLPGKAPARHQVWLVRANEPLDRVLVPGEEQVDPCGALEAVSARNGGGSSSSRAVPRAPRPARGRDRAARRRARRRSAGSCRS